MKLPEAVLNRLLTQALRRQGTFADVRSEVRIGQGMRADILAYQKDGAIALFELKARPLRPRDIRQISAYTECLEMQGFTVYPHLVGDGWPAMERPAHIVFMDWSMFYQVLA